ncbi:MAG TPA: zinc-binding dehydrogenase [Acidimicrobiales bacterium]|jgi:alcohol dehydrogenase|nr:zinc-binding dehydrogenase [Acidimicrobiales bacterium]
MTTRDERASGAATALVLDAPRQLTRRTFAIPRVGVDDAVLRVEACGLCGTDHELFTGTIHWPAGFIPGHETVGVIEAIGERAATRWGVAAGERVAVGNRRACRECTRCMSGDLAGCERFGSEKSYGMYTASEPPGLWGGYATHHYLAPESVVHPVPAGIDPVVATMFNPLAAGLHWAVATPALQPGEVVAVLGPGVRGIAAAVAAKAAGASTVLVTGFGPRDLPRLHAAQELGADIVVDVASNDPIDALRSHAGRLADVVVDVTARSGDAFGQALELAAPRARVVCAGVRGNGVTATFEPDIISMRELQLIGVRGVSSQSQHAAVDLIASGRFPFERLPRRTAGFDDIGELLSTMAGEGDGDLPLHAVFVPR